MKGVMRHSPENYSDPTGPKPSVVQGRDAGENLIAETSLPAGRQELVPELKKCRQHYEDRATDSECYPYPQKYGPSV